LFKKNVSHCSRFFAFGAQRLEDRAQWASNAPRPSRALLMTPLMTERGRKEKSLSESIT
jgi:hypothetical protein